MNDIRKAIALACLLIAVLGCAVISKDAPVKKYDKPWLAANSISAEAVISVTGDRPVSGKALILAKSPEYFRIDVKGAFGATAAMLISDSKSVIVSYGGDTNVYAKGADNPYLPYAFTPFELVTLLLGAKNIDTASLKAVFKNYDVTTDGTGNIIAIKKQADGGQSLNVALSDFNDASGALFPSSITIEDGSKTISIRYTKIEINPFIANDSFEAATPMIK